MHIHLSKRALSYITVATTLFFLTFIFSTPTLAAESTSNVVETNLFGNVEDDGSGCGVFMILSLVLNILSGGVGVAGLIGISIVGIKYLTSAGNEEQARQSRHRMFQILIGLAVFAVMYAITSFLLPGGTLNTSSTCKTISTAELNKRRAAENAAKQAEQQKNNNSSSSASNKKNSTKTSVAQKQKKMLDAAKYTAKYLEDHNFVYGHDGPVTWKDIKSHNKQVNCASYTVLAASKAGLTTDIRHYWRFGNYGQRIWMREYHSKYKFDEYKVPSNIATMKELGLDKNFQLVKCHDSAYSCIKSGKLTPGDIIGSGKYKDHTLIYAGRNGSACVFYEVGSKGRQTKSMILNNTRSCAYPVGWVFHIK